MPLATQSAPLTTLRPWTREDLIKLPWSRLVLRQKGKDVWFCIQQMTMTTVFCTPYGHMTHNALLRDYEWSVDGFVWNACGTRNEGEKS